MTKTEYLYNIKPQELKEMNYFEAIEYKKVAASRVMRDCVDKSREENNHDKYYPRYIAAQKAKIFNESLLNELML